MKTCENRSCVFNLGTKEDEFRKRIIITFQRKNILNTITVIVEWILIHIGLLQKSIVKLINANIGKLFGSICVWRRESAYIIRNIIKPIKTFQKKKPALHRNCEQSKSIFFLSIVFLRNISNSSGRTSANP